MTDLTRREWTRLALGGLAATMLPLPTFAQAKKINSRYKGVLLGAQTYSFRDRPLDKMIESIATTSRTVETAAAPVVLSFSIWL